MKQKEVLQVFAKEFGSQNVLELNKILKDKAPEKIKFKIMGEALGHLGLTVAIKNITDEGLKIFDVNRVRLARYTDMETFEKAKPKVPRPVYDKPKKSALIEKLNTKALKGPGKPGSALKKVVDDDDNEGDEDFVPHKKKSPARSRTRTNFIPKK